LREEHILQVLQKRALTKILGLKGTKEQWNGEDYIMRSFYDLYSSPNIILVIKSRRMRWMGM
jgi:hypothetical protein